jgi:hypothetical protein
VNEKLYLKCYVKYGTRNLFLRGDMPKKPFKPKRELLGRYYTWSELASGMDNYIHLKESQKDEDRPVTSREIFSGNAFGQLYGQAAHAFVQELIENPSKASVVDARWKRFWRKWLVTKTKGIKLPAGSLNDYLESGFFRGKRDMANYLEVMKDKIIGPSMVEVLLENVGIRGTGKRKVGSVGFHLTVKIDQLHPGIGQHFHRDCIVDLKFDNCTDEEFRKRAMGYYRLQMNTYAVVYLDYESKKGNAPAIPVTVLLHIPTKTHITWIPNENDIAETRILLKETEKKYRPLKEKEKALKAMMAIKPKIQASFFPEGDL